MAGPRATAANTAGDGTAGSSAADAVGDALREVEERDRRLTESQARFLTIASHELRTPLTSIAAFTDMVADEATSADHRAQAVAAVQRNVRRMLHLMEDLHLLSRLVSADLLPVRAPVDLPDLLGTVTDSLRAHLPATRIDLTVSGGGAALAGDEGLLRDLFYGAIGVLAAQTADGRVEVAASTHPYGWSIVATRSTGEPVTADHLLTADLPTPGGSPRPRSTALWILIADAIAHSHGGDFTARIEDGSTAVTRTRLPGP